MTRQSFIILPWSLLQRIHLQWWAAISLAIASMAISRQKIVLCNALREVIHAQLEALPAVQSISSREVMPADREVSPPVQRELGMTNIVRERKGLLTCQARKYLRDLPDNSVEFSFPTGSVWHRVMAKLQERKQFLRGRGCTTTICMYDFLLDTLAARLFNRCKYVGSKFCTSGFEGQDGTVSS